MKMNLFNVIFYFFFFSVTSIDAQTKVLTTDGKTLNTTSIKSTDNSVILTSAGENKTLSKADILAVVPENGRSYTFKIKNGKKLKIKSKDIYNNYEGADRPRIFAYKYLGSDPNAGQLYVLNSDSELSEVQFKSLFNEQQKKLKTRGIVSMGLAVVALILGAASLSSSLSQANALSYNSPGLFNSGLSTLDVTAMIFTSEICLVYWNLT